MTLAADHALNTTLVRHKPRPLRADPDTALRRVARRFQTRRYLAALRADQTPAVEAQGQVRIYRLGRRAAFAFDQERFTTQSDEHAVIRQMLIAAREAGCRSLEATGGQRFKQRAWILGQAMGIEVAGHQPSPRDQALAAQLRDQARDNVMTPARELQRAPAARAKPAAPARAPQAKRPQQPAARPSLGREEPLEILAAKLLVQAPDQMRDLVKAGLYLGGKALDARWRRHEPDLPAGARHTARALVAKLKAAPTGRLEAVLGQRLDLDALAAEARLEKLHDRAGLGGGPAPRAQPEPGFAPLPRPKPKPAPAAAPAPGKKAGRSR